MLRTSLRLGHINFLSGIFPNAFISEHLEKFQGQKINFFHLQVSADLELRALDAVEAGDTEAIRVEKEAWKEECKQFYMAMAAEGERKRKKHHVFQLHRVKAHKWLVMVDSQLRVMTGDGLQRFSVPRSAESGGNSGRLAPENQHYLVAAVDQGSDGWSALNYLLYGVRWAVLVLPDISHRCWNDANNSFHSSNLWGLTLVLTLVFSLDQGPWQDGRWWQTGQEGVQAFLKVAGVTDPLFTMFLPKIARDLDMEWRLHDDDFAAECFEGLGNAWSKRQPRVSTVRWFDVIDAMREWKKIWHSRLVILYFLCICLGHVQTGERIDMLKTSLANATTGMFSDAAEKTSTKKDCEHLAKLRKLCQNTMHMAFVVLHDADMFALTVLISSAMQPLRDFQTLQITTVKSPDECLEFYTKLACGEMFKHCKETLAVLSDLDVLEAAGLWIPGSSTSFLKKDGDVDHPKVLQENYLVSKYFEVITNLFRSRFATSSLYKRGFPLCFPALLGNETEATRVLEYMKRYDAAYENLCKQKGAYWKGLKARSPMEQTLVENVYKVLRASKFKNTQGLQDKIRELWRSIGQSDICEIGLKTERAEEEKSYKKCVSSERAWMSLVEERIASTIFRYNELRGEQRHVPRGIGHASPKELCTPQVRMAPKVLGEIKGTSQATKWYSPKPEFAPRQIAEIQQTIACSEANSWGELHTHVFLCGLVKSTRMLLRRKTQREKVYFSMGILAATAVVLMPAKLVPIGADEFFCHDLDANEEDVLYLILTKPEEWEAVFLEVLSPLGLRATLSAAYTSIPTAAVLCAPSGSWDELVVVAAKEAFFDLGVTWLRQFASHEEYQIDKTVSLYKTLHQVLKCVLPRASESELLDIIMKRMASMDQVLNVLQEDLCDVIDDTNGKREADASKEISSSKDDVEFTSELVENRRKYESTVQRGENTDRKRKGAASSTAPRTESITYHGKQYPKYCSSWDTMTNDAAELLLPPGFRWHVDDLAHRYLVKDHKGRHVTSKAWLKYGRDGSRRQAVQDSWLYWQKKGFGHCPIERMFEAGSGASAASGSG